MTEVKVNWGSTSKTFQVKEGQTFNPELRLLPREMEPRTPIFNTQQGMEFANKIYLNVLRVSERERIVDRFREARSIHNRRKQVIQDFASRHPEFAIINATSKRKGLSTNEQFTELRKWFFS